jgi:hypothetical protein
MRNRALKQEPIHFAFGKSGLDPFKTAIVLELMLEYQELCTENVPRSPIPVTPERSPFQDPYNKRSRRALLMARPATFKPF